MTTTPTVARPIFDRTQCPMWCTDDHPNAGHPEDQHHSATLASGDVGSFELYEDVTNGSRCVLVDLNGLDDSIRNPTPARLRKLVSAQQVLCDQAASALERLAR